MLREMRAGFGKGGAGIDSHLESILRQLRRTTLKPLPSGAGITRTVKSTRTLQDAAPLDTLQVNALIGGQSGDRIRIATTRGTNAALESVFDLDVYFTHTTARPQDTVLAFGTADVSVTPNTITISNHRLETGRVMQLSNTGGGLPAGTAVNTLYWVIRVDATTIKLASTKANAIAGTAVDITTVGTGAHFIKDVWRELFSGVSMVDTHRRYVETVVNTTGLHGRASDLLRVVDLDSATGDQRPADLLPTVLVSGANEVALAGVFRGDEIIDVLDLTVDATPATLTAADWAVSDDGKVVCDTSGGVAAVKGLLLHIAPFNAFV